MTASPRRTPEGRSVVVALDLLKRALLSHHRGEAPLSIAAEIAVSYAVGALGALEQLREAVTTARAKIANDRERGTLTAYEVERALDAMAEALGDDA